MRAVLLAILGALLSVLAFPPVGPGLLIVPGIALFLYALSTVDERRHGLLVGAVYGVAFFGGLMWWLVLLDPLAAVLIPVQAAFMAAFGFWIVPHRRASPANWLVLAVGGWAVMELIRYHFPVDGLEWGAAGYALSDDAVTRLPAQIVGTSGLTILVVILAAIIAQAADRRAGRPALVGVALVGVVLAVSLGFDASVEPTDAMLPVTIVQGSTPCPFQHCPPDERLLTYRQHLALTQQLEPVPGSLIVWPESSTGSTNADPVLNDDVREAIASEARRLQSTFVVGGDRVVSDTTWINANVYFGPDGEILGEYRKQHPVPFGEYIPLRPLFDWIPALSQVPRDMIRGDGPVVIDSIGSVISFEGGFSRYALATRRAGAEVIIVNTNESSYGPDAPTADQFIGMTRMRAVELGVPIIHAAVTGKSAIIDLDGEILASTSLGEMVSLSGEYRTAGVRTPYVVIGNSLMYVAALAGVLIWVTVRVPQVLEWRRKRRSRS